MTVWPEQSESGHPRHAKNVPAKTSKSNSNLKKNAILSTQGFQVVSHDIHTSEREYLHSPLLILSL